MEHGLAVPTHGPQVRNGVDFVFGVDAGTGNEATASWSLEKLRPTKFPISHPAATHTLHACPLRLAIMY